MNYAQIIKAALMAVKTVEQLMPDSPSKDKIEAALAMVEGLVGDITAATPGLLTLFTQAVNFFRAVGLFKTKTS